MSSTYGVEDSREDYLSEPPGGADDAEHHQGSAADEVYAGLSKRCCDQPQSRLLSLPDEILSHIYDLVLADYEDEDEPYDSNSILRRPGYIGPHKVHCSLLQTCQSVYNRTWYMPLRNMRHTCYFPSDNTDNSYLWYKSNGTYGLFRNVHALSRKTHRLFHVEHIQIFGYRPRLGKWWRDFWWYDVLAPRELTITTRHIDFPGWQRDDPLVIHPSWRVANLFPLPESVLRLKVQFETLLRKQDQLEQLLVTVSQQWTFPKSDSRVLVPVLDRPKVETWQGPSTWNNSRWVRDEMDSEPGQLTYCIGTIVFEHDRGGAKEARRKESLDGASHPLRYEGHRLQTLKDSFTPHELSFIGCDNSTSKGEVLRKWQEKLDRDSRNAATLMLAMLSAGGS